VRLHRSKLSSRFTGKDIFTVMVWLCGSPNRGLCRVLCLGPQTNLRALEYFLILIRTIALGLSFPTLWLCSVGFQYDNLGGARGFLTTDVGDGQTVYQHGNDGKENELAGCSVGS